MPELTQRPSARLLRFFRFEHLPVGKLRAVSQVCCTLAHSLGLDLPECAEKTAGLRHPLAGAVRGGGG